MDTGILFGFRVAVYVGVTELHHIIGGASVRRMIKKSRSIFDPRSNPIEAGRILPRQLKNEVLRADYHRSNLPTELPVISLGLLSEVASV